MMQLLKRGTAHKMYKNNWNEFWLQFLGVQSSTSLPKFMLFTYICEAHAYSDEF